MKNNFITILVTVLITGTITFFVTKQFCGTAETTSKPTISAHNFRSSGFTPSVNAHKYSDSSATADIDTLQHVASIVNKLLKNSGLHFPPNIGQGVVGYTISAFDLLGALGYSSEGIPPPPMKFVRVYMGFNDTKGYKMFVVPVDISAADSGTCCGRDLFFDTSANGQMHINPIPGQGRFVLDLISPCPSTCDDSSKLIRALNATGQIGCSSCLTTTGNNPIAK